MAAYTHFAQPPLVGIPAGIIVSVLIAAVIGVPTLRLSGHYFSMATIAVAELVRLVVTNTDYLGAAVGLSGPTVPRTVLEPRSVRRLTAPDEDFNVINIARTATEMQHAGIPVNMGAHGQREGLAAHWEMWTLALGGMKPLEAIRVATLNGAKYLGMDKDIGSLEAGKLADLAIINGDVLADIRHSDRLTHVMINGRLYESATMNEVGATPKTRKTFFFENGLGSKEGSTVPVDGEAFGVGRSNGH